MKKFLSFVVALAMTFTSGACNVFAESAEALSDSTTPRKMEYLTRGAVGAYIDGGVYLSWRLLGTEPVDTKFNVYRNGKLIEGESSSIGATTDITNFTVVGGGRNDRYQVAAVVDGKEQAKSEEITILQGHRDSQWSSSPYASFDIPITPPKPNEENANGCSYYEANDASVGDLDCDGEYEVVLKWNPDNARDSSGTGITGNVYIDAYEMNGGSGEPLWRIDLGRNIRAGAHYTQFIVYDFDGDGKAEVAMKTAPGSKDGNGDYVTKVGNTDEIRNADNSKVYIYTKKDIEKAYGHILGGPEYLTIFDGQTGKALQTIDYKPSLGTPSSWGDAYANRADRYLAGVAYLDGVRPSLFVGRGYYNRSAVTAYNWDGTNLTEVAAIDSGNNKNHEFYGQGNHQISVADLDNDGKDEIIYGSAALKYNGTKELQVWQSMKTPEGKKWGHGDALHVSDFDGDGKQEIFSVLEDSPTYGTAFRKGTESIGNNAQIWKHTAKSDTGRGIMDHISKTGSLGWTSQYADKLLTIDNKEVPLNGTSNCTPNFAIFWDGDLLRELAEGERIIKWNDTSNAFDRILTIHGVSYNNYTKKNPCLQADLFGDWREEIIYRTPDSSALRVFTSLIPTDYKVTTLMHDSQYRCAVAWQNVGYNQPPHQSFYLDETTVNNLKKPNIETPEENSVSFTVTSASETPAPVVGAEIQINKDNKKLMTIVTDLEGKSKTPILPGEYSYTVKCSGYLPTESASFTVGKNENKELSASMTVKDNCTVTVSYLSDSGEVIKQSEKVAELSMNNGVCSAYRLDDRYKENLTVNGVVYEYKPNLSSDTLFEEGVIDNDIEIRLVFAEKTIPDPSGKEIYYTNFSKDGFDGTNINHAYTTSGAVTYGQDNNGVKYGSYNTSGKNDVVYANIPVGLTDFIIEFDMTFTRGNISGGESFGLTLFDNRGYTGPTVGVYFGGAGDSYKSHIRAFWGTGTKDSYIGPTITDGTVYRYVLEYTGEKLYMTVGDKATGEIILEKYELGSLRNIKPENNNMTKINKLAFGKIVGNGDIDLGLGEMKVYQIGGANSIEWPMGENITVNVPSQTNIAPEISFKTGINDYKIPVSTNVKYEVLNADNTAVTSSAVTVSDDGVLNVTEEAKKGNYKVICKKDDNTVLRTYNVKALRSDKSDLYNSAQDETGGLFKYTGDSGAKLTYKNNMWTFEQNSTDGGREFYGDFFPTKKGKATLKFKFSTGGTKNSSEEWDWTGRTYGYTIQLLDADYNGENPDSHVVLGLSQEYAESGAKEAEYYGKSIESTYLKNPSNQVEFPDNDKYPSGSVENITSRSSTNWNVTVDFDFDNNMASLSVIGDPDEKKGQSAIGYVYENLPVSGGFKTLRFVSNGDSVIQWKPQISEVSYSKEISEASPVDPSTIKLVPMVGQFAVDFDEPENEDSPVIYNVTLTDPVSGEVVYEKSSESIPVIIENGVSGSYNVKISSVSSVKPEWKTDEVSVGPLDVEVLESQFEITGFEKTSYEDGKLKFNAIIENRTNEAIDCVVFAGLYDENNTLIGSAENTSNLTSGQSKVPFEMAASGNKLTLKAFVWNSAQGMKPILDTKVYEKSLDEL